MIFSIALGAAIVLGVRRGYFVTTENRWQDELHRLRGPRPPDPRIVVVAIDDKSIKEIGQYPWPRSVYAPLIRNLDRFGARVIGFDVLFLEPSRPQEDRELLEAVRAAGNVVLAATIDDSQINSDLGWYHFQYAWDPLRRSAKASALVYCGFCLDDDGALRRFPLVLGRRRYADACPNLTEDELLEDPSRLPAFGTALVSQYTRRRPEDYAAAEGSVLGMNFVGDDRVWMEPRPDGAEMNGRPLMMERRSYAFPRLSAIDVIRDRLAPEEKARLKGAIVLVGSTAESAYDHYPTPVSQHTPGVEIHATVADNLLQGNGIRRLSRWIAYLAPLAMILLADELIRLSPLSGSLCAVAVAAIWAGLSYLCFLHSRRLNMVAPNLALGIAYFVMLTQRVLHEHREKRWVKNTFSQYLSPKVIEALAADPDKLRLGGEKRDMSIFFIDIAHFTSISERMDPEALTHFLNHYLTALTNVILKNDGVVDKYIGDCIMAFWNAPMDQPRHRELACLAALECVRATEKLNGELRQSGITEKLSIRVGVNSGHAVVGNMGSDTRFSYTVIGDAVNVASRLEGANKFFGSHIMASEDALDGARHLFEARELGRIRVVGKDTPLRVFDILELAGKLAAERQKFLEVYHEGLANYYERRFQEAARAFEEVLRLEPEDKTANLYLDTSQSLTAEPPGPDWDGVFNLTSK